MKKKLTIASSIILLSVILTYIGITIDMGPGLIIIILLRLFIPLTIFRWPLWGTVASATIDLLDVVIADILGAGGIVSKIPKGMYDKGDKIFDMYYLAIACITSLSWKDLLAKWTSIILFVYRIIGVILFEVTGTRWLLLVFPNLFEHWFLFWAARNKYFKKFKLNTKKLILILLALLIPKLIQEYLLHYAVITPWTRIKLLLGLFQR